MKIQGFLDALSEHLKNVLAKAISIAQAMHTPQVYPAHMLLALLKEPGTLGAELLRKHTKNDLEKALLSVLAARIPNANSDIPLGSGLPELSDAAKRALERAMSIAYDHEHTYIGTDHLLAALLSLKDPDITAAYTHAQTDTSVIEHDVSHALESTARFPSLDDMAAFSDDMRDMMQHMIPEDQQSGDAKRPHPQTGHRGKKGESILAVFATELTTKAAQEQIDPVIGRETEIDRVITILSRRTKNNPVLVGEPGVGKTAIVEGLAKRIAEGTVPYALKDKKIYALDLALLVSGTIYRGEFESRLKQLIDEVSREKQAVLFIDELHNIIGAGGSNQGTMDAANILKPALARGKLHCIGATTLDEYKKHISADPALERRFQSVIVEEPSVEDAEKILTGVAPFYEAYHAVTYTKEATSAAVQLSSRYIHDNFLPDKAIDLLDEAGAAVRIRTPLGKQAERQSKLLKNKEKLLAIKAEAIATENFNEAVRAKNMIEKIEKILKKLQQTKQKKETLPLVEKADIAHVVSQKLHINKEVLLQDEWQALSRLPQALSKHIIGQDHVIAQIISGIERAILGISSSNKPLASFLFVGPSGVGKTALAKMLVNELYHDEKALIRIDMSEFGEAHGVSKLLGSPAGYVGYKERNRFLDDLRHRPYAVVLFDECDKAHPDVRKLLLQILDEGVLKDSSGKSVSFKHAIIILTSNAGAEWYKTAQLGFGSTKQDIQEKTRTARVRETLSETFGETVLGRLDAVCYFHPLTKEHLRAITKEKVETIGRQLRDALSITVDSDALDALLKEGFHAETGMRNMDHAIEAALYQAVSVYQKKQKKKKGALTLTHAKQIFSLT